MEEEREIATAPGDLPAEMVLRRLASAATQFRHDNTIAPPRPRPDQPVVVTALSGARLLLRAATLYYTTDGSQPNEDSTAIPMRAGNVVFTPFGEYQTSWTCTLPGFPDKTWVRYVLRGQTPDGAAVHGQDGQGFWFRYDPHLSVTTFSYRVAQDQRAPDWFRDAVLYQIFLDRFGGQSNVTAGNRQKHGGTITGVREALPYIRELGVTCLWLSPIGVAPSYHRYDATDYFKVDPVLGGIDDLRELVAECHDSGIRVILDFVPSHFSSDHPAFREAQEVKGSPYTDWFTFYRWPDQYRSFLESVPSLASVNTQSTGLRDHIKQAARYWITECDIDGYRLDHVIGHGMDFWNDLQQDIERIKPGAITVGEATDTGDSLLRYGGRLTSILDFPIARALRLAFGTRKWSMLEFDAYITQYEQYMADGPHRASFLDNHDMDRFLFVANQNTQALLLAALCLLTLPPTPIIYYGTEIGMTHLAPLSDAETGGDAQARGDMIWDSALWNQSILRTFRELIALRQQLEPLRRGERRTIAVSGATGLYHYARVLPDSRVDVAFVLGDSEVDVAVPSGSSPLLSIAASATRSASAASTTEQLSPPVERWTLSPGSGVLFASENKRKNKLENGLG